MRSHLLHGVVRHRRPARSRTGCSTACSTRRSTSTSWTRWIARCGCSGATARARSRSATTDHLVPPAADVRSAFLDHLRAQGEDPRGWRITLVANLRVAGYVFDPASFFLCRDADGVLRVVVVEVHNTHGERHLYTLRPRDERLGRRSRPRWTRRSTSRRSSSCAAATRSGSATSRRGCASPSTSTSPRASSSTRAWTSPGGR